MKIIGRLCDRIDTVEGKAEFTSTYDIEPFEYVFEYELFHISRLFAPEYEYIAFLEYDGEPRQVFYLEPGEHIMVYNTIEGEIFNTDTMAFFSLIRDSSRIGTFCTEHSPWSFRASDTHSVEEMSITSEQLLININDYCKDKELPTLATFENTLIVRAL